MDLDALLSALQTTQQKKSSARLSERNVVELVLKLKQLGFLGDDLLHTINGKEYITQERLKADVAEALRQAGGRLELTELPALVGVDLAHCEKQAALIVAESGGSVIEAQGELITTQYFDSLAAEVNDMLQEAGVLSMADLAVTHNLNAELLRSTLAARVGSAIAGQLDGGLLYTPSYLRNVKAQLRGALRGTAAPVALASLARELSLDGSASSNSMVAALVDELLAEGAVRGSTRGGGGSWVPSVHTAAQQGAVGGFYGQNGWVGYELVRRAGISGERAYLKQAFPDGLALDSVYVSPAVGGQAEAAVEEAVRNASWLDVAGVLPPALGVADITQLLDRCDLLAKDPEHKRAQVLASTCVVSAPLIAAAREKAETLAKQEADRAAKERKSSGAAAAAAGGGAADKGGGKKGPAPAASKDGNDSDDDWSMGGGKKGKKGKAGGGAKGKGKAAGGGGAAAAAAAGGKQQAKGSRTSADGGVAALSPDALEQLVLELFPDMEDAGPSGDLPAAVAEVIRPAALAAFSEALASCFTSHAEDRRRAKEAALKALEESFALLQLYGHGCELLASDEATLPIMQRHLLRSTGMDAVDALLSWCKWEFVEQEMPAEGAAGATGFASPAERAALVKALPPELAQPLGKALEATNGTDVQELLAQLEAAGQECGIRLRRLDKKGEKALASAQRARLLGLLVAEASPAAALAVALPLLALKVSGRAVNIPGRAIGGVLAALQPDMPEGDFALAQRFHQLVVDSLVAQSRGGGDEGAQAEQELAGLLPQLKALVGA